MNFAFPAFQSSIPPGPPVPDPTIPPPQPSCHRKNRPIPTLQRPILAYLLSLHPNQTCPSPNSAPSNSARITRKQKLVLAPPLYVPPQRRFASRSIHSQHWGT